MNIAAARNHRRRMGRAGEDAGCELLKCCGMEILARNWRCRAGELDIVALDGDEVVFAEVKSMRINSHFSPSANLSFRQRRRNFNAGKIYMRRLGITGHPARFDLIEVGFAGPFIVRVTRSQDYLPKLPAAGDDG